MSEPNPYAPPNAVVSDINLSEEIARPRLLDVAAMLLWTSLIVWALTAVFDASAGKLLKNVSPVATVIVLAVSVGVNAGLTALVVTGRNWARILWLVLCAVGFIAQFATGFPSGFIERSTWVLQTVMNLAVFGILLTPTAARWFKR